MVFDLESNITGRTPKEICTFTARQYSKQNYFLEVWNSFDYPVPFTVTLVDLEDINKTSTSNNKTAESGKTRKSRNKKKNKKNKSKSKRLSREEM